MKNKLYAIINIIIIAVIAFSLYTVIDKSFGLLIYNPSGLSAEKTILNRKNLSAYRKEQYVSDEFLKECIIQLNGWITPEGTLLVLPKEFHGKYFNVDRIKPTSNPYRRTINNSNNYDELVLILGGSTVYCSEVPDALTFSSLLSKELNSFVIINGGVASVNSTQELFRLKYEIERGLKPKIVVVYNGVNDIVQGLYYNNPKGVMFSSSGRTFIKRIIMDNISRNFYRFVKSIFEHHNALKKFSNISGEINVLGDRTKEVYVSNIIEMANIAKEKHFRLIVILQPNLFMLTNKNQEDVVEAYKLMNRAAPGMDGAFNVGYPKLRRAIEEIKSKGIEAYDFSQIFNDKSENIFLDICHVNSVGDKIIAQSVAKIIGAQHKLSASY